MISTEIKISLVQCGFDSKGFKIGHDKWRYFFAITSTVRCESEMGSVVEAIRKGISVDDSADESEFGFACWKEEFGYGESLTAVPDGCDRSAIDGDRVYWGRKVDREGGVEFGIEVGDGEAMYILRYTKTPYEFRLI